MQNTPRTIANHQLKSGNGWILRRNGILKLLNYFKYSKYADRGGQANLYMPKSKLYYEVQKMDSGNTESPKAKSQKPKSRLFWTLDVQISWRTNFLYQVQIFLYKVQEFLYKVQIFLYKVQIFCTFILSFHGPDLRKSKYFCTKSKYFCTKSKYFCTKSKYFCTKSKFSVQIQDGSK